MQQRQSKNKKNNTIQLAFALTRYAFLFVCVVNFYDVIEEIAKVANTMPALQEIPGLQQPKL